MMKILLLLDMNGTLCYRSEESVRGARADLFLRRKFFYARFGLREALERLAASGMFRIVVYSSMMRHNIVDGLNAILPGGYASSSPRRVIDDVLDREMNKPDPQAKDPWDTVRDLSKVWVKLPDFGPRNTILLDNEARKFGGAPANGIVVPEFGPAEVLAKRGGTLSGLVDYLLELGAAMPADVRAYMADRPFRRGAHMHGSRPAAPLSPAPAASESGSRPPVSRVANDLKAADDLLASLATLSMAGPRAVTPGPPIASSAAAKTPMGAMASAGAVLAPAHDQLQAPRGTKAATVSTKTAVDAETNDAAAARACVDVDVPPGTSVRLICIEDGRFTLTGTGTWGWSASDEPQVPVHVCVRGPAAGPLRVDVKNDFFRLVADAAEAGVELEVRINDIPRDAADFLGARHKETAAAPRGA